MEIEIKRHSERNRLYLHTYTTQSSLSTTRLCLYKNSLSIIVAITRLSLSCTHTSLAHISLDHKNTYICIYIQTYTSQPSLSITRLCLYKKSSSTTIAITHLSLHDYAYTYTRIHHSPPPSVPHLCLCISLSFTHISLSITQLPLYHTSLSASLSATLSPTLSTILYITLAINLSPSLSHISLSHSNTHVYMHVHTLIYIWI